MRREFYKSQDQLKSVLSTGVCDEATAETPQFRAMGTVSGTSRYPKDVPFVSEFWWGTYGLGAIDPRKEQISAKFLISNLQNCKFQRHSTGGDTLSSSLYCSVPPQIGLHYNPPSFRFATTAAAAAQTITISAVGSHCADA